MIRQVQTVPKPFSFFVTGKVSDGFFSRKEIDDYLDFGLSCRAVILEEQVVVTFGNLYKWI